MEKKSLYRNPQYLGPEDLFGLILDTERPKDFLFDFGKGKPKTRLSDAAVFVKTEGCFWERRNTELWIETSIFVVFLGCRLGGVAFLAF